MKAIASLSVILLIIGGLNWGLVGLFDFNLVTAIFGEDSLLSDLVFILVGVSAITAAATLPAMKREKLAT